MCSLGRGSCSSGGGRPWQAMNSVSPRFKLCPNCEVVPFTEREHCGDLGIRHEGKLGPLCPEAMPTASLGTEVCHSQSFTSGVPRQHSGFARLHNIVLQGTKLSCLHFKSQSLCVLCSCQDLPPSLPFLSLPRSPSFPPSGCLSLSPLPSLLGLPLTGISTTVQTHR